MIIALLETGSKFDLPLDLKLNIEMASPIFSKAGSMSLPVSLPLTDKNRKLLQFPDHLDIYDSAEAAIRAIPDISVLVTQGSWQQVATMSISGCSDEAVEATLYFNESNIWSKLDAVTVPQTMAGMRFGDIPEDGQEENYRAQVLAQFYDYMVPPHLSNSELNVWLKAHDFIVAIMKTKDGWLNEPAGVDRYVFRNTSGGITLRQELMLKEYTYGEETYKMFFLKSEFDWYTTSECYGKTSPIYNVSSGIYRQKVGYKNKNKHLYCTGFLRLDVVIKQIFNHIGYTLDYDFSTYWPYNSNEGLEVIWNQIVVLNNTMDAIYPGYMPYSALVPEVSAKDFIAAVQAQFGVVFILQPDNKTVKMQFTDKILKLFSKTRKLDAQRDKQITFNSSPDYTPSDEMDKIKAPEYLWDLICDPIKDAWCSHNNIDPSEHEFGNCYSFELDGVCQRTTTTRVGDTDETKTSECPLAFGVCTEVYNARITVMERIYMSVLIDSIHVWSRGSQESEDTDDLDINTAEGGIYKEFNTEYNIIAENSDRITVTTVLKTLEVNQFDFTTPYIIQGRLCWPAKLQYELENSDKQHVTIEFIAGRKL